MALLRRKPEGRDISHEDGPQLEEGGDVCPASGSSRQAASRAHSHTRAVFAHSRGRWDIDNRFKVLFDAMTEAGVWSDDSQVDRLESEVVIVPTKTASRTVVVVSEIEEGK